MRMTNDPELRKQMALKMELEVEAKAAAQAAMVRLARNAVSICVICG